jgi:hypothetical protein
MERLSLQSSGEKINIEERIEKNWKLSKYENAKERIKV